MDHFDKIDAADGGGGKPAAVTAVGGELELLGKLSVSELKQRLADLEPEMNKEIEELRRRYQSKRQPILDAMEAKRRRSWTILHQVSSVVFSSTLSRGVIFPCFFFYSTSWSLPFFSLSSRCFFLLVRLFLSFSNLLCFIEEKFQIIQVCFSF